MSNHYCHLMTAKKLDEINAKKQVKVINTDKDNLNLNRKVKEKKNKPKVNLR